MYRIKIYIPAIVLVLCGMTASGITANDEFEEDLPSYGSISGTITEEGTGTPLEYSTIAVYSAEDSSLVGGTVSDQEGKFEVKKLPDGQYYIETNYIGYEKKVIDPVYVTPDSRAVQLGTLKLSVNTQAIEEVEIVADRKRVDYRLDKKVVNVSQDINTAGGTAVDVLENTPSVSVDIEGNVSLRGSGSFTVLIDGKPSVLTGSDALRQIPASAIENIEIITNPSAKYDPDGNAGIINVNMKQNIEKGTNGIVNASVGINNKYRADFLLNRRRNNWNFFVGGNYNNNLHEGSLTRKQITFTDTLDRHLDAEGLLNFKWAGVRLRGGASYDFSEKSSLSLEAMGGTHGFMMDRSNTTHEYSEPLTEDIYYASSSIAERNSQYFGLNANYTRAFDTKDHKLTALVHYSRNKGDAVDSQDDYNTGEDYVTKDVIPESSRAVELSSENEFRFQLDYTRPSGENGKLEAGYQARIDDEFEDYLFEDYNPGNEDWIENELYTSDLQFFRSIQSAYVTYGGKWKGFQYQLGLRGEHTYRNIDHEKSPDAYLINRLDYYPTIHLGWEFKNDHQIMVSYSKRVDRPRGWSLDPNVSYVDPYTIRMGNPELQPEYIHSYELGYQKGWGMNFLALELYYRNTRNLMTRVTEYDETQELFIMKTENLNQDHAAGAEIMANWKFWKFLTVNGSFTPFYYALSGEIKGISVDENSFNWRSSMNTTFQITPTTRFQVNMDYRSKSVTAQGYSNGYYYMNLAFRQDLLNRKLSATLQLRDVFGTVRRDTYSFGENFEQHMVRTREPRVLTLTLSYRINNYKFDPGDRQGGGGGGMDMGGDF